MKLTIVGGSNGLGFAILNKLKKLYDKVSLIDIVPPCKNLNGIKFIKTDLSKTDFDFINEEIESTDTLIITAGLGYIEKFENLTEFEIKRLYNVNACSPTLLIKKFFKQLKSKNNKKCMIISSISGEICSPLMSVYGAAKASISKLCESLNIELIKNNSKNRITAIYSVSFKGSSFNGGKTDIKLLSPIANECIKAMNLKETKHYINKNLCSDIINRYQKDISEFGLSSYNYKITSNRINHNKRLKIGYLSGTFDLFHVGHLNILKKAKENCDYLIVGVHKDGSKKGKETLIPLEDRKAIVNSIIYVDKVVDAPLEDSDAWNLYKYDCLFVGSDYKGTERFKRYHKTLKNKASIIYFPYTKKVNSTQLRAKLKNN